jgi:hypothetical protein
LRLLESGLATYRLARLLTQEDGPFEVCLRLRVLLGAYDYGDTGEPSSFTGKLISCPYCVGIWVALGLMVVPDCALKRWLVRWVAIAGVQTVLHSWGQHGTY